MRTPHTNPEVAMADKRRNWTLGIVSVALFMVVLDNLVVSVALPSIRRDLGASIQSLEWTVNAYVLAYAVLLLTGAALGDRFGRKRMFIGGLGLFTVASAAAALAPSTDLLISARGTLDLPGLALASTGAFGLVFGLVRAQSLGWGSPTILAMLIIGIALLAGFVIWERRAAEPMLPMRFFASRAFAVTNVASLSMYFGMFGSIFFLSQFMQNVLHNTPFQAGLKLLVWTGSTMVVAPLAGVFSERFGSRPFMAAGLSLQAAALGLLASMTAVDLSYGRMIVPFVMAGAGMALVFAPSAAAVLASVRPNQAGQASGANNAIREVGGVLGVAVLASVFTGYGGYASPQAFVAGLTPALWTSAAVLSAGALTVLALPFSTRRALAVEPSAGAQGAGPQASGAALGLAAGESA
jgi:MFS family permease